MTHPEGSEDARFIHYADTYALREAVLGQPPVMKPDDDAPTTRHVGVYVGGRLISICSIYAEAPPGRSISGAWRLRGVATLPDAQRQGGGRLAVERCAQYAAENGGGLVWCYVRPEAVPFYRALGFTVDESPTDDGHGVRFYAERALMR